MCDTRCEYTRRAELWRSTELIIDRAVVAYVCIHTSYNLTYIYCNNSRARVSIYDNKFSARCCCHFRRTYTTELLLLLLCLNWPHYYSCIHRIYMFDWVVAIISYYYSAVLVVLSRSSIVWCAWQYYYLPRPVEFWAEVRHATGWRCQEGDTPPPYHRIYHGHPVHGSIPPACLGTTNGPFRRVGCTQKIIWYFVPVLYTWYTCYLLHIAHCSY